jgi:integrase
MKGSLRQRNKGSWEITIDIGRDPASGKRLRHFETVKGTKKDAQRQLAELLITIEQGSYVKPRHITFGEWLNDWLISYVAANCSPRTLDSYRSEITNHIVPSLGAIPLTELRAQHLQSYYAIALAQGRVNGSGGLSQRTVQYQHRIISESLSHAMKMGLLARNVAHALAPPRPKRPSVATVPAEDAASLLLASRETRFHAVYCTALFTGMRLGELLGLRWCDVDLQTSTLSVAQALLKRRGVCQMVKPKSAHSQRLIAMSHALATLLRQHRAQQEVKRMLLGKSLEESDLVFAHPDGTPLDPGTVSKTFSKVLVKAGLPHLRFHDLRHTHATLMLRAGIHPKIVQERLGHGSIAVTLDTYSDVVGGLQEAAAHRFERAFDKQALRILTDAEPSTEPVRRQNVGNEDQPEREPPGTRTQNRLIKSQLLFLLS